MNTIDWSNAPEGATHYYHGSSTPWRDLSGEKWKWFSGDQWHCSGSPSSEMMDDYSDRMTEKPSSAWNGEGLPPVGLEVEWLECKQTGWQRVTVLGYYLNSAWIAPHKKEPITVFNPANFRPIRTPDQIAEEERIAGLNEMIRHIKDHPLGTHGVSHLQELMIHEDVARDLWEAGYRKQEAK